MAIVRLTGSDRDIQTKAYGELKEYFSILSDRKDKDITYKVHTYGCQLNAADGEKLSGMLEEMGLKEAGEEDVPDVMVLNTCSIRENAENHLFGNLGEMKSAKKNNRDMLIIICGCMMKVKENTERIRKSFPYVDLAFDPQQLHNFPVLLRDSIASKKQLINICSEDYIAEDDFFPIKYDRKFRALVPIMYGCNNFCTYCIVPYTRGRERSRNFDSIIDELKALEQRGFKEVMLLGQNVNSYGAGDPSGKTFADIFDAACDIKGFSRVRFMSSHPKNLSDDVIDIMSRRDNAEKHLHLAMQSGSDRVLKRMNRPYTIEKFMDIADKFRSKVKEGSLTTDIIVGFPGETEEDFKLTLDAVDRAKFDAAFTFQFSPRPGTPASKFEDPVPADVVTERFGRLLELQNRYAFESNQSKVGKTYEVLIEGRSKGDANVFTGRTLSNHLVNLTLPPKGTSAAIPDKVYDMSGDMLEGLLCDVRMEKAKPYSVEGVMESIKL